jgi:prolipoprotein diacylglyceryltransferase
MRKSEMINLFWKNITRYPKFLITSMSGLIVIILAPFLKLAKKNKKSQLFLFFFLIFITAFLSFILNEMLNL